MKTVGNVIAILIVALIILGIYSNFLISEQVVTYFVWAGIAFSILIILLIAKLMLSNGSRYRENMKAQGKSPLAGVIVIIIFVPFMVVPSFYKGLPVVLNFIVGKPEKIVVTVLKKPAGYYKKRCSGGLYLSEYRSFTNDKICGIEEGDWRKIQMGDKLELIGKGSIFGFSYKSYSKLTIPSSGTPPRRTP